MERLPVRIFKRTHPLKKKKRSPNFCKYETNILFKVANESKQIIENKSSDLVTTRKKAEEWNKIAKKFNSESSKSYFRDVESLKNKYENTKNASLKKTGAGPRHLISNPDTEVVLDVRNEKTVHGLDNSNDGDAEYHDEALSPVRLKKLTDQSEAENEINNSDRNNRSVIGAVSQNDYEKVGSISESSTVEESEWKRNMYQLETEKIKLEITSIKLDIKIKEIQLQIRSQNNGN